MRSTIRRFSWSFVGMMFLVCSNAEVARAATIYTYTGGDFVSRLIADETPPRETYTTSMRVSGFFELNSALAPGLDDQNITADLLNYSFNDGRTTITPLNAARANFVVSTDDTGQIVEWVINLSFGNLLVAGDQSRSIFTSNGFDRGRILECGSSCRLQFIDQAMGQPGQWTVVGPSPVPLPAPVLLLAAALGGLGLAGWASRRTSKPRHS